jgi:hypothetical protein
VKPVDMLSSEILLQAVRKSTKIHVQNKRSCKTSYEVQEQKRKRSTYSKCACGGAFAKAPIVEAWASLAQ